VTIALGVTEAQLTEAIRVLRFSGDLFIVFTTRAPDRVTVGPSWQDRCEDEGLREHDRTMKESMMGKRTSAAKQINKELKGNGSSVDQQILATLRESLSSLRAIESHLLVDTGTMEQRLDDILRELHRHRPARE
jgi:hypothetical protein